MGSANYEVVWNDSDFPIQYCIYGAFEELGSTQHKRTINPQVNVNVSEGAINLEGFQSIRSYQINPTYAYSFVEVQPKSHTSVGLTNLEMDKHKISIRIKIGDFVKYLAKDVVIKSENDLRLKIRDDFSIKMLGKQEARQKYLDNQQSSHNKVTEKKQRMQRAVLYGRALRQLQLMIQP